MGQSVLRCCYGPVVIFMVPQFHVKVQLSKTVLILCTYDCVSDTYTFFPQIKTVPTNFATSKHANKYVPKTDFICSRFNFEYSIPFVHNYYLCIVYCACTALYAARDLVIFNR